MMKPRRLPRIGGGENNTNPPTINKIPIQKISQAPPISKNRRTNLEEDLLISNQDPDFIRKYRRMRNRHQEDFAISLVPNKEDIISEDTHLYDNKNMNLDTQRMKENIGLENTEFYIESIHHDQYYKINQIKKEEKKICT